MAKTFYCPVCASQREAPKMSAPKLTLIGHSLLWAALSGGAFYLVLGWVAAFWGAFVLGLLCFLGLEVYYTARLKDEMVCPVCHFDPVLYRRSPEEAKEKCLKNIEDKAPFLLARWQALRGQKT